MFRVDGGQAKIVCRFGRRGGGGGERPAGRCGGRGCGGRRVGGWGGGGGGGSQRPRRALRSTRARVGSIPFGTGIFTPPSAFSRLFTASTSGLVSAGFIRVSFLATFATGTSSSPAP